MVPKDLYQTTTSGYASMIRDAIKTVPICASTLSLLAALISLKYHVMLPRRLPQPMDVNVSSTIGSIRPWASVNNVPPPVRMAVMDPHPHIVSQDVQSPCMRTATQSAVLATACVVMDVLVQLTRTVLLTPVLHISMRTVVVTA